MALSRFSKTTALCTALASFAAGGAAANAAETAGVLRDGRIGFVLSDLRWAIYQTADAKAECPHGLNDGPREQYAALFPADGTRRTLAETQLAREGAIWHPQDAAMKEPIAFKEAEGRIALGLNLDGKIGPNDLTGPDGEQGIDNELWRVLGCIAGHRGPEGDQYHFINEYMHKHDNNRFLVEISEVDDLRDDDHVVVTTYRGRDSLLTDATGSSFIPGGTQRTDMRWGKTFVQQFTGRIVGGLLVTDTADANVPMSMGFDHVGLQHIRGMRFHLKLAETGAEGYMAGYADVDTFYRQSIQGNSTHHLSYGQQSAISVHRALARRADAYPDRNGRNTAISSALKVKLTQAYIVHDAPGTAAPETTVSEAAPLQAVALAP